MNHRQIEVQIMGQRYLLGCPEDGQERLKAAVDKVDAAMCKIRDAGKIKARDRIAVLAALNLAFEQQDAAPQTAPVAASADPHVPPADDAGTRARLQQLIARLDQALGRDGQLL